MNFYCSVLYSLYKTQVIYQYTTYPQMKMFIKKNLLIFHLANLANSITIKVSSKKMNRICLGSLFKYLKCIRINIRAPWQHFTVYYFGFPFLCFLLHGKKKEKILVWFVFFFFFPVKYRKYPQSFFSFSDNLFFEKILYTKSQHATDKEFRLVLDIKQWERLCENT